MSRAVARSWGWSVALARVHLDGLRRKSFIRPHKAAAGRRLAPALHSKAGHRICSRSHEECVLTWLACCDRLQDYSFLLTMGANGVLGLFIDIKALTSNSHFKVDWPTWGLNYLLWFLVISSIWFNFNFHWMLYLLVIYYYFNFCKVQIIQHQWFALFKCRPTKNVQSVWDLQK